MQRIDDIVRPNPHTKAEAAGPKVLPDERLKKKRQHSKMVEAVSSGAIELPKPLDPRSELAGRMRAKGLKSDAGDLSVKKTKNGVFDLWEEREADLQSHREHIEKHGYEEDWYQPQRKKPKMYSEERTASATKRSGRPAIELPEAGTSYHPDYESHQQMLQEALDFYSKKADRSKAEAKKMPRIKTAPEPIVFEESDSEDEKGTANGDNQEEDDDDVEKAPKVNNSHVPRLSKEELKKREKKAKHERALAAIAFRKEQNRQAHNVKRIANAVDDEERMREAKREARKEMEESLAPNKILRIGPAHYTHRAPEFVLTEDLPGSFRRVKATSSVLEDRFDSLQKRNMVEVRHKSKLKRTAPSSKVHTRKSFKDAPQM